jgi:hypothetical protein
MLPYMMQRTPLLYICHGHILRPSRLTTSIVLKTQPQ